MILYVEGTSNVKDVVVDYIDATLMSGEEVSLNWDESDWSRGLNGSFSARLKGVCFGEEYANGREHDMKDIVINEVGFCSEDSNFSKEKTQLTAIAIYANDGDVVIWEDKK
ncbi:MAG: hypothetical protein RR415_13395 [Ruthenibacterium sp.]